MRAVIAIVAFLAAGVAAPALHAAEPGKPLEVLLVAGGCCHDYATQTQLLKKGIEARLRARVEVAYNPDRSTKATFDVYSKDDWDKATTSSCTTSAAPM